MKLIYIELVLEGNIIRAYNPVVVMTKVELYHGILLHCPRISCHHIIQTHLIRIGLLS